jgi:hypothetical protein
MTIISHDFQADAVSAIIGVLLLKRRMVSVAMVPFMPGKCTSISTKSNILFFNTSIASSPLSMISSDAFT